jgi:hypothetical protein
MARRLKAAALALALVLIVAALLVWRSEQRAVQAEREVGLAAARTLSETFSKTRDLRVATLSGQVLARGSDPGFANLLPTSLTVKYPYSVDYFLDLKRIDAASYRWNAATKTMTVRLPDVTPSKPSVDAARAERVGTTGVFMSRDAAQRLGTQVAARAALRAAEAAAKPVHLDRARASAREAMESLVATPLQAAGLGEVKVVVRYPWEGTGTGVPVRWDESRAVRDVYRDKP